MVSTWKSPVTGGGVGLTLGVGLTDGDGLTLGLGLTDGDADGVGLDVGPTTPPVHVVPFNVNDVGTPLLPLHDPLNPTCTFAFVP
ncbi:hypothetical protein, partial [Cellulomonas wangsupingiae]|uniref:hypothetical protein n=1 Tax=Cellulomonas wangsupingiae TaxID=2968085 RepID=UPI001D0EB9D5